MTVLVAVPMYDTATPGFVRSIARLMQANPGAGFVLHDSCRLHEAQTLNAQCALNEDYSHILFVDSDVSFAPDVLQKLMERDCDVVGCACRLRQPPYPLNIVRYEDFRNRSEDALEQVRFISLALALVKTDVFRRLPEPWFQMGMVEGLFYSIDDHFMRKCRNANIPLYCDWRASKSVKHRTFIELGLEDKL